MTRMNSIPQHYLQRARRALSRRIAATLVECMANTDAPFNAIAGRIDQDEDALRRWLYSLVDGADTNLDRVSDFCLAMGVELEFSIRPCSFLVDAPSETETAAAQ